jgi:hypothetical protein
MVTLNNKNWKYLQDMKGERRGSLTPRHAINSRSTAGFRSKTLGRLSPRVQHYNYFEPKKLNIIKGVKTLL